MCVDLYSVSMAMFNGGSLVIGSSDAGAMDVNTAHTFAEDVTFISNGVITLNSGIILHSLFVYCMKNKISLQFL